MIRSFLLMMLAFCVCITPAFADVSLVHEWKFDELSGSVAYDSVGDVNCTLYNFTDGWVGGRIDGGLEFNSTLGQYADCGDDSSLDFGDNFSVDLWLSPNVISEAYERTVFDRYDSGAEDGYYLVFDNATSYPRASFYQTDDAIICGWDSFDVGQWHHLALTYESDLYVMYGDGIELCNYTVSQNLATLASLRFGGVAELSTDYFYDGTMDGVRFWSGVLSPTQVGNIYLYDSPEAPPQEQSSMEVLLADVGEGLGAFLSAVSMPVGNFVLLLGVIAGVLSIVYTVAYAVKSVLKR